jgi:hypothetical protein
MMEILFNPITIFGWFYLAVAVWTWVSPPNTEEY